MLLNILVLSGFAISLVLAGIHDAYTGNAVYKVQLRDTSDQKILYEMEIQQDVDIWQHGMPLVRDAIVMVTPKNKGVFLETLKVNGFTYSLHLNDVPKVLEQHDEQITAWQSSRNDRMIFQGYPRYDEIDAYMETIAARYPNLVTLVNAGPSFEGRDIKYLKISTTNFTDTSKPIYFMEAMLHAREWVTTPVTLFSIFRLVENLRFGDEDLLNDIDWIILPLANPDGYEFSHTDTRLWRKTMSINATTSTICRGVDGNRNFDIQFGTLGVSTDPCMLTYPGHEPFSEPETRYVRDILHNYVDRIQIFMDIHSHGNWVLFGYGDTSLPPNAAQLHQVGAAMGAVMDSMKIPQAPYYVVGNSASVLYGSSGSAQDYGQHVGIPFSYTLELPGYGYSFQVPPEYQDHINEETWHGIAITARLARSYYRARFPAANKSS